MGRKKEKQRLIEEARQQRKADRQTKRKLHKKMAKADSFKLSNLYLQYYSDFDKEIKPMKIKLRDVVGDGNCLFRAFADQVDGNQTTHIIMREEACKYMVDHQEFFQPFLDEDEDGTFQNYMKLMKKNGEWGGHLELQALCECFKCIIVVHKRHLQEFNVCPMYEQARSIIHLGYFQHEDFEHYVSIRQIDDDSEHPALFGLEKLNSNMYAFLLNEDPEAIMMRQQLQNLAFEQKEEEAAEQMPLEEPFPGYNKNKKCKCGKGKIDYRHCCFKDWQVKLQKFYRKS